MADEQRSGMPSPSMAGAGAANSAIPMPNTADSTHKSAMPKAGAPDDRINAPGSTMNPVNAPSGGELPRFVSQNQPAGKISAAYEPGLIEIQFRDGTLPQMGGLASSPTDVRAQSGAALDGVNAILSKHGVVSVSPTFRTPPHEASAAQATAVAQGIDAPHLGNFVTVLLPANADVHSVAAELAKLPEIERAVPVPKVLPPSATLPPPASAASPYGAAPRGAAPPGVSPPTNPFADPLVGSNDQAVVNPGTGFENQWYLYRIRATSAWSRSSGSNVVIADIDWGCRTTHQDLHAHIDAAHTHNAFDGGTDVTQGGSVFHGTGVLGLAGGIANGVGMVGVAFDATLWPIQADSGPGAPLPGYSWSNAIEWVRNADSGGKRKIINLEVQTGAFGNIEQVPSVNAAIKLAIAHDVVVCVAAGNGNRDATVDDSGNAIPPTGSILVGATSYDPATNPRAWFSNFGPTVVVAAPGDSNHDVTCTNTSDTAYRNNFGGTSGATPKVSGTVALMLSLNPNLSHADIRSILNASGGAVVTDAGKPVGRFLNADAAVAQATASLGGRLEVFARGSDDALWHIWQTAPNNGWSGWASQGGWIDQVGVARNADGRLEAFARGSDGALWHMWQTAPNNGWSGWASLGGWIDMFTIGQNADGRLEIFARGSDKALWHIWQTAPNNGWSGWSSLGGWIDMISVGQNKDGRLEVFARGSDKAVWHIWQTAPNNGWSGWSSLGGWIDLLTIGRNADGRLEIFARGSDKALWHMWQTAPNNGWSGWSSLGGWIDLIGVGADEQPEMIVKNKDGRLEIFARGADRALWHIWQTAPSNGWSAWSSLGGWIDRLAASRNADGRIEVFARGSDHALWHIWQTAPNNGWSGWSSLGGWIDMLAVERS